jgi:HlyD family secretion protein
MNLRQFYRIRTLGVLLLAVSVLLSGCAMPQFGRQEEEARPEFSATPYAAELPPTPTPAPTASAADAAVASVAGDASAGDTGGELPVAEENVNPRTGRRQYNGEIVPKYRTSVAAEAGGMALDVPVEVGDEVEAGDLLAQVDASVVEAQRAQALAALEAAQAQLDLLTLEADPADLEAARAGVSAAAAAYQRAVEGATAEDERMALAQLQQAQAAVTVAQAAYNEVKGNPRIGQLPQSLQLQQATLAVEAAQAQYDKVLNGATNDVIAGAYAQLAQARAQLVRLEDGAKPAQIQAVEAQVKQAETALYLAQLQLDKTSIDAPVAGTVVELNVDLGSMVAPGMPVATIMSHENEVVIQVEETQLADLRAGQSASLLVDAYPNRLFEGEVIRIAPELNPATRTVAVTIRPLDEERLLAPGMFTTVELLN